MVYDNSLQQQTITVLLRTHVSLAKEYACHTGDGVGMIPGGGHDNPLQYSCLESPMDGGAWWTTVHRTAQSQLRLSD